MREVQQTRTKYLRVEELSILVGNGTFRLWGDGKGQVHPSQQELFDEMTQFPGAEHDDLVDAAGTGSAYLSGQREVRVWSL